MTGVEAPVSLKEMAKNYVAPKTMNIADLESVEVTEEIKHKIVNEGTEDAFSYHYIERDEVEYRVPITVIKSLKEILEARPDVTVFKVKKTGEGKTGTKYTVIPL